MSGIEQFSGFEVIRAAMEVEKSGHRFYSAMAAKARHELVREIFSWLAQDEVEHLRRLKALEGHYQDGAFADHEEEFLPYLQRFRESEIFPSAERLEALLAKDEVDLQALDLAIEAEEKFAAYFEAAAGVAAEADGREAFSWLAGEERRHATILTERKAQLQRI